MTPTAKSWTQIVAGVALVIGCVVMFYNGSSDNWTELIGNWRQLMAALGIGGLGGWQVKMGASGLYKAPPPVPAVEGADKELESELDVWVRAGVLAKKRKNEAGVKAALAGLSATLEA
jgi:hypothetical protein